MRNLEKYPTFRELLERNTNLLTILAIFNALSIYSMTIDKPEKLGKIASFVFLLLSMFVLVEIIKDFTTADFKRTAIMIFGMLLMFCEATFGMIMLSQYYPEFKMFVGLGSGFGFSALLMLFAGKLIEHHIKKRSMQFLTFLLIMPLVIAISIILGYLTVNLIDISPLNIHNIK